MLNVATKRTEKFQVWLAIQEEGKADPIHDEIQAMFAELQGDLPVVSSRGTMTRQTVIDADEPTRSPIVFVPLQSVRRAETKEDRCPHKIKNCHMEQSCNYRTCLRLALIGRES